MKRLFRIHMLLLMAACLLSGCGTSTEDGVAKTVQDATKNEK